MATRSIHDCRGILTGASSGIGRALTSQLVREGAEIVAVARRGDRLRELADSLSGARGQIEIITGDVTDGAIRQAAIDLAREKFGSLNLLINNAGTGAMGRFAEATPERLRQVMNVNFFAAVELIHLALPHLRGAERPIMVNVSSILGHRGIPFYAEYCASKFALQGLSESLRAEFAPLGIDLLVVSPGTTESEFFESAIDAREAPWPRVRGVTAEVVARRIVRGIRRGRHEVITSGPGRLLVWMNRLFPWAVDRVLARYG